MQFSNNIPLLNIKNNCKKGIMFEEIQQTKYIFVHIQHTRDSLRQLTVRLT